MASPNDDLPVKSAGILFRVINVLQAKDGAGITEVADELGVAKSTANDHLKTLERLEYVVNEENTYRLSLKFLDHGMYIKNRNGLPELVKPLLQQLASETDEMAWLIVKEHGKAVYLEQALGNRAVPTYGRIGRHAPLHCLAGGKAILSQLPEDELSAILGDGQLEQCTSNTILEANELRNHLEEIRDRGFAFNVDEVTDGVRAVGAPILANGEPKGAISVSGPANRMRGDRFRKSIPDLILGATNEIELKLTA